MMKNDSLRRVWFGTLSLLAVAGLAASASAEMIDADVVVAQNDAVIGANSTAEFAAANPTYFPLKYAYVGRTVNTTYGWITDSGIVSSDSFSVFGTTNANGSISAGTIENFHSVLTVGDTVPGLEPGQWLAVRASGAGLQYAINDSGDYLTYHTLTEADSVQYTTYLTGSINGSPSVFIEGGHGLAPLPADVIIARNSGASEKGALRINNSGFRLIECKLAGNVTTDNDYAILINDGTGFSIFAREGDQAVGFDPGVTYKNSGNSWLVGDTSRLNNNGTIVFRSALNGYTYDRYPDQPNEDGTGVWMGTPGNMQLILKSGDTPPGIGGGFLHLDASNLGILLNDQDRIAFVDYSTGELGESFVGLYADFGSGLQLVAQTDDLLPDGSGVYLSTGSNGYSINQEALSWSNTGNITFFSTLSGPNVTSANNTAILQSRQGAPFEIVARTGDPAVGLDGYTYVLSTSGYTSNDNGYVVFAGSAKPTTGSNITAVWSYHHDHGVQKVIAQGDEITYNGEARIISSVNMTGTGQGQSKGTALNIHGQLVLRVVLAASTTTASQQALIVVDIDGEEPPACAADFNDVNGVTVQDIFDFLTAWLAGSSSADFNTVNGVTVQDIFDFLTAWLAGC